jgi:anti-anti-sigma factor
MADQKLSLLIGSHHLDRHVVVQLVGPASLVNVEALAHQLMKLSAKRPSLVVFDMSECPFICSLAIGTILEFHRGMKDHHGEVRFAGLNDMNAVVFRKLNLHQMFTICATADEALGSEHRIAWRCSRSNERQ